MLAESLHQQGVLQKEVIEQLSNYLPEEQNKIEDEDAEDALIYGIECYQLKDNIFYESMISLSPITSNELQFINNKRKKEPIEIKKFMVKLIREKLIDEENPHEYQKGISYVTLDVLDIYAEYATKILLDKIYFYDHFHPEILIKKGLFSDFSSKDVNEFYIPIDINISINGINYIDNLNWDLLNQEMIPENFAEFTVKDEKLDKSFVIPISYQIRRGIHNYVFNLLKNFANNYDTYIGDEKILLEQIKLTRHSEDTKKNIPTFLFDAKLSKLLGKK